MALLSWILLCFKLFTELRKTSGLSQLKSSYSAVENSLLMTNSHRDKIQYTRPLAYEMAIHLIKVVMILKLLLSWPPMIWEELVRMRMAWKNYTKDRKKNELVTKGNLQGLTTIMLVWCFPTQWDHWRSHDALWQSPTHSNALPVTPYTSCIQPKPPPV